MKKQLAVVGLSAGLAAGAAAGFAFTSASPFAGAENSSIQVVAATPTTVAGQAPADRGGPAGRPDPSVRLGEVLEPLVEDKTITQEQADKVIAAIVAARPAGRDGGPGMGAPGEMGGRGGKGGHDGRMGGPGLDAAAKAIGITADELRTELQSGTTIAAVAGEKNVDVAKVVEAMVAEAKAHFAAEVASGEHTQAEVDQRLTEIEARITARVNGEAPPAPTK